MKRVFCLLIICLSLVLAACGSSDEESAILPEELAAENMLQESCGNDSDEEDGEAAEELYEAPVNAVAAVDGVRILTGSDDEGEPLYGEALTAGQPVKVHTAGSKRCLIETENGRGTVPRWAVFMFGDVEYVTWTGTVKKRTAAYSDEELTSEYKTLRGGTKVNILYGSDGWLYAESKGDYFFLDKNDVTLVADGKTNKKASDDWTPSVL